jgi:hypothetical protein
VLWEIAMESGAAYENLTRRSLRRAFRGQACLLALGLGLLLAAALAGGDFGKRGVLYLTGHAVLAGVWAGLGTPRVWSRSAAFATAALALHIIVLWAGVFAAVRRALVAHPDLRAEGAGIFLAALFYLAPLLLAGMWLLAGLCRLLAAGLRSGASS